MIPADLEIVYSYHDESGVLQFEVIRRGEGKGKMFVQRRPDGRGSYIWNLDGVRHVLYRLPQIQGAQFVFIPEGEKDADRLVAEGAPQATTNHGGAGMGKWLPDYSKQLADAGVKGAVILPDNDEVGLGHAKEVARSLKAQGILSKIIRLPGPEKSDISDWLNEGHTIDELHALVAAAPIASDSDLADAPTASQKREKKTKPSYSYANVYRHFLKLPKTVKGNVMLPCPFHVEDTPSFSLSLSKGEFFCHGNCTEPRGGGVVTFIQKWYQIREDRKLSAHDARLIAIDIDVRSSLTGAKCKQDAPRHEAGRNQGAR